MKLDSERPSSSFRSTRPQSFGCHPDENQARVRAVWQARAPQICDRERHVAIGYACIAFRAEPGEGESSAQASSP